MTFEPGVLAKVAACIPQRMMDGRIGERRVFAKHECTTVLQSVFEPRHLAFELRAQLGNPGFHSGAIPAIEPAGGEARAVCVQFGRKTVTMQSEYETECRGEQIAIRPRRND